MLSENLIAKLPNSDLVLKAREKFILKFKHSFNAGGHDVSFLNRELKNSIVSGLLDLSDDKLQSFLEDKVREPINFLFFERCATCGKRLNLVFDGDSFAIDKKCEFPDGIEVIEIELNVPSGKIVFANDLRKFFKAQDNYDVNYPAGILKTMRSFEGVGMAHGFVGNTCPGIYQKNSKNLSLSSGVPKEIWNKNLKKYIPVDSKKIDKQKKFLGKKVGGICTDLWWYSAVDYDDFKEKYNSCNNKNSFELYLKNHCDVVDVIPGLYKFKHYLNASRSFLAKMIIFAKISWQRAPENKFSSIYKNKNHTIGQAFLSSIKNYPTLYGFSSEDEYKFYSLNIKDFLKELSKYSAEQIESATQRFYDYIFFTIGNGVEWHENGWGTSQEIVNDTPDFKMPILTKSYSWYPLSENFSDICIAAGLNSSEFNETINFNESFLMAAYECLGSILYYGTKLNRYTNAEEQIKIVKKCLFGLSKKYPETLPVKFSSLLN